VIVPNPTVETEDGSVSVSNVKKIEVTNGDLTNDGGRVVSIDTAGSVVPVTPGGSNTDVQINDGGSFGGASTLTFASSTLSVENAIDVGASGAGGRVECSQNGQDLQIKHTGTGKVEVVNATTDTDTDLQITGPGTGNANLTLSGSGGGITFTDGTTQSSAASGGVSGLVGLVEGTSIYLGEVPASTSSADSNVALGDGALTAVTTGDKNTVAGNLAGEALTTNYNNALFGYRAGSDIAANGCTFIGADAGRLATTGSYFTAIGHNSMGGASGFGEDSVGLGHFSHYYRGSFNVALGGSACVNTASSNNAHCVAVGHEALRNVTGDDNIGIGFECGRNSISGTGNVIIGQSAYPTDVTTNNQLAIAGGAAAIYWIRGDSAGSCYQGDNASTWSTTSDERLKRDITDLPSSLAKINQIQLRNFRYVEPANPIMEEKAYTEEDGRENKFDEVVGWDGENRYGLDPVPIRTGVIAQELQNVFPDAVTENAHGHLIVNPDIINWNLVKAVQELSAKIDELDV